MHNRNHAMESQKGQKCNFYNFGDRSFLYKYDVRLDPKSFNIFMDETEALRLSGPSPQCDLPAL